MKKKVDISSDSKSLSSINVGQLEKLTRLLALLVVKGESQPEKIKVLAGAGFTNTEIAELLEITANAVNIVLHRLRTKK